MSVSYEYSLSVNFPSGLRSDQLQKTIENTVTITVAIIRIDTLGDAVFIIFVSALSGAEKTILDGLVAAHVPDNQSTLGGSIWQTNTVVTSDNTTTTLSSISTDTNTVIFVQAQVVAIEDVGTNEGGWQITRTYKNISGTLSTISGQDSLRFRDQPWEVNLTTSGTNIILNVQGEVGTNISWKSSINYSVNSF